MVNIFKYEGESIVVDVPFVELYVPYFYYENNLYRLLGEQIELFGILNYRTFRNEKEMDTRDNTDTNPIGISAFFKTFPYEKEVDEVSLYKNGPKQKVIILRYRKGDKFIINKNIIKSTDNAKILTAMLDQGQIENIPYRAVSKILSRSQLINNINYGMAEEDLSTMVAERYRNPNDINQKARFMKNPTRVVSINPRESAYLTSTYGAIVFEDINTSLLVAHNRKTSNIKEEETIMEKMIKGKKITE